jgi:hypothetical protein
MCADAQNDTLVCLCVSLSVPPLSLVLHRLCRATPICTQMSQYITVSNFALFLVFVILYLILIMPYVFSGSEIEWLPDEGVMKGLVA